MDNGASPYEFRFAATFQESDDVTIQIDGFEHNFWPTTPTVIREAYAELWPLVEALSTEEQEVSCLERCRQVFGVRGFLAKGCLRTGRRVLGEGWFLRPPPSSTTWSDVSFRN